MVILVFILFLQASLGWLDRFRKRNGTQIIQMKGQQLSTDPLSDAEFPRIFVEKIVSENLKLDNIYNADELGINWRVLTACTLALRLEEEEVSSKKESKDRVTALLCSNATGSHRIPLLTIGKPKTPECLSNSITKKSKDQRLKTLESLGVIYTNQSSACVDQSIFLLW